MNEQLSCRSVFALAPGSTLTITISCERFVKNTRGRHCICFHKYNAMIFSHYTFFYVFIQFMLKNTRH